jgi:diguanylate cyclase (GGDEF)-like protein
VFEKVGTMDLIGDPGTRELGYVLLLFGTVLLAVVFAIQTLLLSRRLRLREEHGRRMEEMAFVDPLTRLPNRRLLLDRLQHALYASDRQQTSAAVYFLDLDEFKTVNDEFGHDVGDQVLSMLAERWMGTLRAVDTLARWGGDEFIVLTEGMTSSEDIHAVLDRLRGTLDEPIVVDGHEIKLTLSAGVALACTGAENPADVIRCADAAMYRVKRSDDRHEIEIVGLDCCFERLAGHQPALVETPGSQYVRAVS